MNSINLFTIIDDYLSEFRKIRGIHWLSEHVPYDAVIIGFAGTKLKCKVTEQPEEHCFLFSVFWEDEPDDPVYTDGCVEYSEKLDTVDCEESLLKNTAWALFNEMNTIVKQYAPRFA